MKVLEFPAGLLDNENVEENALRELHEETGYLGAKIINYQKEHISVFDDPWKSNENGPMLFIEIDGNCETNLNPK